MRIYYLRTYEISHPTLGSAVVEIDQSESDYEGWWRQKDKFNGRLLPGAVGRWDNGRVSGSEIMLFGESPGMFTTASIILNGARSLSEGAQGSGVIPSTSDRNIKWRLRKVQEIQEYTIEEIAKKIVDANWRFVTSEGVNVGGGPGAVGVTFNLGAFYVKGDSEPSEKPHKILYSTAGISYGASKIPISISGSTTDMISGGIGKIFNMKLNSKLSLYDFEGFCSIIEVSGIAVGGAGLYAIFFHQLPLLHPGALLLSNAIGFMYGTSKGLGVAGGGAISTGKAVIMY